MNFFKTIGAVLLSWGPLGILLLSVADSAGIPIPEGVDVLIVTMSAMDPMKGYISAVLAVAGSVLGSFVLYQIGRKGGHAYIESKTQKGWQRRFKLWFDHYGLITVFVPALIPAPLPMKIFVLSAGAFELNRFHFVLVVLAARIPRYLAEAYLGTQLGNYPWQYLKTHAWQMLLAAVVLFLILLLIVKVKDRIRERELRASSE